MELEHRLRAYYEDNPLMVSSPFGGVDGINEDLFRAVLARLGIGLHGNAILDVGCGRGFARDIVTSDGGTYAGVDLVASRAGFPLAAAEASRLPFPDATFDGVFCIDVFEHIPDGDRAAGEFLRVLRPGGYLFLSVPNYANVAGVVKILYEALGWYEKDTWAPFRQWQPQELEACLTARKVSRLFRRAGFSRCRRIGHGPEVGIGLFPWVEHARMPEAVKFRLQRLFARVGPGIASMWPGASMHNFWRVER
jgi:ubiquinone/menaquinone biosynthesis C-methylase UbiE